MVDINEAWYSTPTADIDNLLDLYEDDVRLSVGAWLREHLDYVQKSFQAPPIEDVTKVEIDASFLEQLQTVFNAVQSGNLGNIQEVDDLGDD